MTGLKQRSSQTGGGTDGQINGSQVCILQLHLSVLDLKISHLLHFAFGGSGQSFGPHTFSGQPHFPNLVVNSSQSEQVGVGFWGHSFGLQNLPMVQLHVPVLTSRYSQSEHFGSGTSSVQTSFSHE